MRKLHVVDFKEKLAQEKMDFQVWLDFFIDTQMKMSVDECLKSGAEESLFFIAEVGANCIVSEMYRNPDKSKFDLIEDIQSGFYQERVSDTIEIILEEVEKRRN
jgi:hypothetical protein